MWEIIVYLFYYHSVDKLLHWYVFRTLIVIFIKCKVYLVNLQIEDAQAHLN